MQTPCRKLCTLGTAVVGFLLASLTPQRVAAQPVPREMAKEADAWKAFKYQNAVTCARCHTKPGGNDVAAPGMLRPLDVVLMTEYSIWKTHDKHAQAYAVLLGPRGQRMGQLLGQDVLKAETGCLNCHAMGNLASRADERGLDPKDGVSCAGCHGASKGWFADHQDPAWRKKTATEKFEKGMRDLRDPATRATLCLSCHVGNVAEGKVATHAMFAAGHPPLPSVEIAGFSRNEPQHWRDAIDVPFFQGLDKVPDRDARIKNYHLEDIDFQRSKFSVVGGVVAMREAMQLAQQQAAQLKPGDKARWPEIAIAHSDCFACHHDLKLPGYRQTRGFGYQLKGFDQIGVIPGRLLVRTWPTDSLELAAEFLGQPDKLKGLDGALRGLAGACSQKPFGTPETIQDRTKAIIDWCDGILDDLNKAKYDAASVKKLMESLCQLSQGSTKDGRPILPDYEMARLTASVLRVAYEDWTRKEGKKNEAIEAELKALIEELDLEPYIRRKDRLEVISWIVGNGMKPEGVDEFSQYLDSIGDIPKLAKLAAGNNVFLASVQRLSNDDFNAGIVKNLKDEKDPKKNLQALSDDEEKQVLGSIAKFDPDVFRKHLQNVIKALK